MCEGESEWGCNRICTIVSERLGGGSECGVVRGGECEWGCNRICTMVSERG